MDILRERWEDTEKGGAPELDPRLVSAEKNHHSDWERDRKKLTVSREKRNITFYGKSDYEANMPVISCTHKTTLGKL